MLQSQINYWNLEETIRHNRATEEAGFQQARAAEVSASASRLQAEVAERTLPYKAIEADSAAKQAQAALMNAETNKGNLDVNRMNANTNSRNADTNALNAQTNIRNADINQQNANTNAFNARVNQQNADINQQNANTNARNADINAWNAATNEYNAVTNRLGTTSQVALNETTGLKNLAEADLTNAKVPEQYEKNYQASIDSQYYKQEKVVDLIDTGSHVINNVGGGLGSLMRGAGSLIGSVSGNRNYNSGNKQSTIRQLVGNATGIIPMQNLANTLANQNKTLLQKVGLSVLGGIE